jgi:hypothetical protein
LDGERERMSVEARVLVGNFFVWCLVRTALQVDGTEAVQVPKLVVEFAELVVVLLRTDVAETVWELAVEEIGEVVELLAAWDVVELVRLLDMAAGRTGGGLEIGEVCEAPLARDAV